MDWDSVYRKPMKEDEGMEWIGPPKPPQLGRRKTEMEIGKRWEEMLESFIKDSKTLTISTFQNFIDDLKYDGSDFIREQAKQLQIYKNSVATGKITADEFIFLIHSMKRSAQMFANLEGQEKSVSLENYVGSFFDILLKAIPKILL